MHLRLKTVVCRHPVGQAFGMTPTQLSDAVTSADPVERWRLEALMKAGYPPWDALVLSRRDDVDLHDAVALMELGCPPELAVRILL